MKETRGNPDEGKKQMVKDLQTFLKQAADDDNPANIRQFVALLHNFLRIKTFTPPIMEIMALIKHEKPKLYHATRLSLTTTSNLKFLFQVDMDPTKAASRLEAFLSSGKKK
ncbi:hypothetical protein LOK74_06035 [Brevibacillus humidisoli]|uniref:hypothetical protein n=1 Tax=Brevibacillus humidisoli TaxID=2895522 RepID=UPI001E374EA5|nr:hypothetical protein [Brevibacillus humidisoli]UFJ42055.1 hypothetical protein LOK74_06035 [Brevibacillus humidisoli]